MYLSEIKIICHSKQEGCEIQIIELQNEIYIKFIKKLEEVKNFKN